MSTFYKEFNVDKRIVIPSIQREYIQPLTKSVINGFVDALVRAYSTGNKKDLNYIYGLESDVKFEPIDGQQRLTTIWLMHLYVAARKGHVLHTKLEYKTRDFSSDFCVKLREKAPSILATSTQPSKEIKNANWFIETWTLNITVSSMLQALDVIHQSIEASGADIDILWNNMTDEDAPVTFAFKSTENLGEDIYVKMNARGKSLSYFENLKSWLDDRLTELVKDESNDLDDTFLKEWREFIDNDWTDLFWRNRNLNDLYPEEIDDEQIRLFYNIAFFLWAQKSKEERKSIIRDSSSIKAIAAVLKDDGDRDKVADENNVVDIIMKKMRKSNVDLPLYILDKLNIFNEDFFPFAKQVLNGLIRYEKEINTTLQARDENEFSDKIYFWELPKVKKNISFMCQLLMAEKDKYVALPKLAIGGALCFYVQNEVNQANLCDWLRFIRNIANNMSIDDENFHKVLSVIKNWASDCDCKKINELIASVDAKTKDIEKQILEEKEKARLSNRDTIRAIHRLENHKFFFGRVGFLFKVLGSPDSKCYASQFGIDIKNTEDYNTTLVNYAEILYKFFGNNGPNFDSKNDQYLAHRVLLACSNHHGISREYEKSWSLFESKNEWKDYYLEGEGFIRDDKGDPHNIGIIKLLKEVGTADNLTSSKLKEILDKHKEKVYDWRRFLIEHPGLWDYMEQKCLRFNTNYDVLLIPGVRLRSNSRRSELRARSLYLELKYGSYLRELWPPTEGEEYTPFGWMLNFWDWGDNRKDKNSCLFFEKELEEERLVIDIYYDTQHASAISENSNKSDKADESYCIELFVRENYRDDEEIESCNERIWGDIAESLQFSKDYDGNHQGRYFIKHISRQNVITLLAEKILLSK